MFALSGPKLAIYGGSIAFLLAVGFAAGHRWQAGEVADAEKAQVKAEADRDAWADAAGNWQRATELWVERYEADQAEAKRQQEEADRILRLIAGQEEAAREEAERWQERFNAAKREPSCKVLMEESTCSAFSDY